MRRADREIGDVAQKMEVLRRCKVVHLAMVDGQGLYSLPLSFGCQVEGEELTLYLHSAKEGRKVDILRAGCQVGFSMVMLLNDDERLTFHLSPLFLALVAFCFSMTIGVLWEFFEFSMDYFLGTDMQKDTIVHALHTVALDTTRSNKVVTIPDIQEVYINGEPLGLGGYLDIGIIDTMKDLFVNFIGAVVFSVTGFFYARSRGRRKTPAQSFVPLKKNPEHDYLAQAKEELLEEAKAREEAVREGEETPPPEERPGQS